MTSRLRSASARLATSLRRAAPRELPQIARIVIASMTAWLIADWLGAPEPPTYAVLVPLLAMREDPYGAFNVSSSRLVGVIAGVLIGLAVIDLVGTGVAAGIGMLAVSLAVGMVLRVGDVLNVQVAVSAFIVFAFAATTGRDIAWARLWETIVGAIVTVVLALLLLPPNPVRLIERRLVRLGAELHDALTSLAEAPEHGDRSGHLVGTARSLAADEQRAQRSVRFNPLQRRLLPALDGLHHRVELAQLLAVHTHAFATDLADLAARDGRVAVERRRPDLTAIATPLAGAVRAALSGDRDDADLQRANAALAADMAHDKSPVAVVTRHPLVRMHTALVQTTTELGG